MMRIFILACLLFGLLTGVSRGAEVVETNVWSAAMGKDVPVSIVLPRDCAKERPEHWPTAYLLHGLGGDHREYLEKTREVKKAVDRHGFIAICPDGMSSSWWVDSPVDPKVRYETFVASELVAWADANLPTVPDRSRRALVGASMGGYGALMIASAHKDVFGAVGAIHPGVELRSCADRGWDIDKRLGPLATHGKSWDEHSVLHRIKSLRSGEVAIYVTIGTSDEYFLAGNRALHRQLVDDGIEHVYTEVRASDRDSSAHNFLFQAIGEREIYSRISEFFARGEKIVCEGSYGGHLQGVATDGESIFWSFTVKLVKTDLKGRILAEIDVPSHHGDLCVKDGVVYVAVNRGRFNFEDRGVSEVCAYAAKDLAKVGCWPLPMCGHGAGGMTHADGRFFVVGGLPATHECNYVYEFTEDFKLVNRHDLQTGFTLMGIQTAAYEDGRFLFGIYGCTGDPSGVLDCPRDLTSFVRHVGPGCIGILKLGGAYWTGSTWKHAKAGFCGSIARAPGYPASYAVYGPKWTGKGAVRVFFDGMGTNGWHDCGYRLEANGYRPLCNPEKEQGVFFPRARLKDEGANLPAVGIGGDASYSAPDLVRAIRRVAKTDEAFALHVVGTPEEAKSDAKLSAALQAVDQEAKKLGVKVVSTVR